MCRKKTRTVVSKVLDPEDNVLVFVVMASPSDTSSPLMLVTTALRRDLASSRVNASTSEGASQGADIAESSLVAAQRIVEVEYEFE